MGLLLAPYPCDVCVDEIPSYSEPGHVPTLQGAAVGNSSTMAPSRSMPEIHRMVTKVGVAEPNAEVQDAWERARVLVVVDTQDDAETLRGVTAYARPGDGTSSLLELDAMPREPAVQRSMNVRAGERSVELSLPTAGQWYVGILYGVGGSSGKSVRLVEGGVGVVHFNLPRLQTITLEPIGVDALRYVETRSGSASIQQVSDLPLVDYPGPQERSSGFDRQQFVEGKVFFPGVAPSTEFHVFIQMDTPTAKQLSDDVFLSDEIVSPQLVASPQTVRAGETRALRLVSMGRVQLNFHVDDDSFQHCRGRMCVMLESIEGGFRRVSFAIGHHKRSRIRTHLPLGTWVMSVATPWKITSPTSFDVNELGVANVECRFTWERDDEESIATHVQREPLAFTYNLGGAVGADAELHMFVSRLEAGTDEEVLESETVSLGPQWNRLEEQSLPFMARKGTHAYAMVGPWLVHRSSLQSPIESLHFDLAPGGYLVVVPTTVANQSLGQMTLQASDGGLIPASDYLPEDTYPERVEKVVAVRPGLILGPLPVGSYSFDVSLGGVKVATASGNVAPRVIRPLIIRPKNYMEQNSPLPK